MKGTKAVVDGVVIPLYPVHVKEEFGHLVETTAAIIWSEWITADTKTPGGIDSETG
jgi:hypothetical protein